MHNAYRVFSMLRVVLVRMPLLERITRVKGVTRDMRNRNIGMGNANLTVKTCGQHRQLLCCFVLLWRPRGEVT